jgi:hypothetical protein
VNHSQGQQRRAGARSVAIANPRGEPAKQGRAVFVEAGPATSSSARRAQFWVEPRIFKSRAKRTAGAPKGRPAKRSAAGHFQHLQINGPPLKWPSLVFPGTLHAWLSQSSSSPVAIFQLTRAGRCALVALRQRKSCFAGCGARDHLPRSPVWLPTSAWPEQQSTLFLRFRNDRSRSLTHYW